MSLENSAILAGWASLLEQITVDSCAIRKKLMKNDDLCFKMGPQEAADNGFGPIP